MPRTQTMLTQFTRDEEGTSALEYAVIAALVAFILIGTANTFGGNLGATFTGVADVLSNGIAAQQTMTSSGVLAHRGAVTGQCRHDRYDSNITG